MINNRAMENNFIAVMVSTPDGGWFEMVPNELESFQRIVGGYIECVDLGHGICLICDEEGKLKGRPVNPYATFYAQNAYRQTGRMFRDVIVGDVAFVGYDGGEEFTQLTPEQAKWMRQMFDEAEDDREESI